MTPQQQKRLGELLAMGVPLPLALPLAYQDPKDVQTEIARAAERVRIPQGVVDESLDLLLGRTTPKKVAKKAVRKTKKQLNYSKAFKKVQNKYKLKSGKWKKDGFKRAVKEAHKLAKKMK